MRVGGYLDGEGARCHTSRCHRGARERGRDAATRWCGAAVGAKDTGVRNEIKLLLGPRCAAAPLVRGTRARRLPILPTGGPCLYYIRTALLAALQSSVHHAVRLQEDALQGRPVRVHRMLQRLPVRPHPMRQETRTSFFVASRRHRRASCHCRISKYKLSLDLCRNHCCNITHLHPERPRDHLWASLPPKGRACAAHA